MGGTTQVFRKSGNFQIISLLSRQSKQDFYFPGMSVYDDSVSGVMCL